jgi:hypothetical protein
LTSEKGRVSLIGQDSDLFRSLGQATRVGDARRLEREERVAAEGVHEQKG